MERKERDPSEWATPKRSRSWTLPWWDPVHDWGALSPRPEAQQHPQSRGLTGRRSIHRLAPPLYGMARRNQVKRMRGISSSIVENRLTFAESNSFNRRFKIKVLTQHLSSFNIPPLLSSSLFSEFFSFFAFLSRDSPKLISGRHFPVRSTFVRPWRVRSSTR